MAAGPLGNWHPDEHDDMQAHAGSKWTFQNQDYSEAHLKRLRPGIKEGDDLVVDFGGMKVWPLVSHPRQQTKVSTLQGEF